MSEIGLTGVPGVFVFVDEDLGRLKARVTPAERQKEASQMDLMESLSAAGYGDWAFWRAP